MSKETRKITLDLTQDQIDWLVYSVNMVTNGSLSFTPEQEMVDACSVLKEALTQHFSCQREIWLYLAEKPTEHKVININNNNLIGSFDENGSTKFLYNDYTAWLKYTGDKV